MAFLFDTTSPSTNPPDTEAVRLGAQRIRELKDLLQTYLAKFLDNTGAYQTNLVPATILTNASITATQLLDQTITAQKILNTVFSDGLLKAANTDPVTVNVDASTITFDSSSPKKIQVATIPATAAPLVGAARNLIIQNNGAAPNTKVNITADEVVLKNATNIPYLARTVSLTGVDIGVTGANGLDTGALAASTWYYVWIIGKTDGTIAGLFSLSTSAPTMPAGYTFKALVGAVFSDASSHFFTFYQQDREVFLNESIVFTGKTGVASFTAVSSTDLTTFQTFVPPIAKAARGNMGNTTNTTGIALAADSNGLAENIFMAVATGQTLDSYQLAGVWRLPLKTAQTFYYKMSNADTHYRVSCTGFTI